MKENTTENSLVKEATIDTSYMVRKSRNSVNYLTARKDKKKLSLYAKKILYFVFMQVKPYDEDFYEFEVDRDELASALNIDKKNFARQFYNLDETTDESIVDEVYEASMIRDDYNSGGKFVKEKRLHIMSMFEYNALTRKVSFRLNPDMKSIFLNLNGANPYYEFFAEQILCLPNVDSMEIFEMLENALSYHEWETGIYNGDWREVRISVNQLRRHCHKETQNYHDFKTVFLVRQFKYIDQNTSLKIDYSHIKSDKKGKAAEILIIPIRRDKNFKVGSKKSPLNKKKDRYFEDEDLNRDFIEYMEIIGCTNENRRESFRKALIRCVNDTLGRTDDKIDVDVAMRIISHSAQGNYKKLFPLSDDDKKIIIKNKENARKNRTKEAIRRLDRLAHGFDEDE